MRWCNMILDKRSAKMMQTLLRFCSDGSYKIIEINDLIKGMLPRYKIDAETVAQIIKYISDNELIDIKYSDDKVYCIAVLPKGRVIEETDQNKSQGKTLGRWFIGVMIGGCFAAAFLGAFVAGLIK